MRRLAHISWMMVVAAVVLLSATLSPAQEESGRRGQRGEPRDRQGMGRFDPAQMRSMMLDRIKQQLNATDEEWKAIEPLVANVVEKQREARSGLALGRAWRRPGSTESPWGVETSQKVEALQNAVENEQSSPEEIKSKLAAVRTEQEQKDQELKEAREELRKVLTLRQEARLVLMGLLD